MKWQEWEQDNLRKRDKEKGSRNKDWGQRSEPKVKEGRRLKDERPRDSALEMLSGEGQSG